MSDEGPNVQLDDLWESVEMEAPADEISLTFELPSGVVRFDSPSRRWRSWLRGIRMDVELGPDGKPAALLDVDYGPLGGLRVSLTRWWRYRCMPALARPFAEAVDRQIGGGKWIRKEEESSG